jgi:putative phosphotransacetylase
MTEDQVVQLIAREVVARIQGGGKKLLTVNVSARHVHLSQRDVEGLFGSGYQLTKMKDLMQPGQFACNETVKVIGPQGVFPKLRVLGPARGDTQLEVSLTDARALGLEIPIRESGKIEGTPGITLEGPHGQITIPRGVIVAARHIHLGTGDANRLGLTHGQQVRIRTTSTRPLTFDDVIVRVSERFVPEMHIDTDEGNAAGILDGQLVEILD